MMPLKMRTMALAMFSMSPVPWYSSAAALAAVWATMEVSLDAIVVLLMGRGLVYLRNASENRSAESRGACFWPTLISTASSTSAWMSSAIFRNSRLSASSIPMAGSCLSPGARLAEPTVNGKGALSSLATVTLRSWTTTTSKWKSISHCVRSELCLICPPCGLLVVEGRTEWADHPEVAVRFRAEERSRVRRERPALLDQPGDLLPSFKGRLDVALSAGRLPTLESLLVAENREHEVDVLDRLVE